MKLLSLEKLSGEEERSEEKRKTQTTRGKNKSHSLTLIRPSLALRRHGFLNKQ